MDFSVLRNGVNIPILSTVVEDGVVVQVVVAKNEDKEPVEVEQKSP